MQPADIEHALRAVLPPVSRTSVTLSGMPMAALDVGGVVRLAAGLCERAKAQLIEVHAPNAWLAQIVMGEGPVAVRDSGAPDVWRFVLEPALAPIS